MGALFLLLTVCATTLLLLLMREAAHRNLPLLPVVTANYLTAALLGLVISPGFFRQVFFDHTGVVPLGLILGAQFIFLFFLMGKVIAVKGVAWVTVVTKMGLILPVLFSYGWYGEPMAFRHWLGIGIALVAVGLISYRGYAVDPVPLTKKLPLPGGFLLGVLLMGAGANDTLFKIFSHEYKPAVGDALFATLVFGTAGMIGLSLVVAKALRTHSLGALQAWGFGVLVGLPNFFSLYFLTLSLGHFSGTSFFPLNNVLTLGMSTLAGWIFYRERLSSVNWLGMAAALGAILLLGL